MPLIPFPDVPPVAGVPDLARLPLALGVLTGITPALQGLDYFGFLPGDTRQWILADDQGNAIVTPDSLVDLGYRCEERVASYPVEQGSLASYNKVAQPQELTVRLSCGGKSMGRDVFLLEPDFLRTSLTLVNVITPDMAYRGYATGSTIHAKARRAYRRSLPRSTSPKSGRARRNRIRAPHSFRAMIHRAKAGSAPRQTCPRRRTSSRHYSRRRPVCSRCSRMHSSR